MPNQSASQANMVVQHRAGGLLAPDQQVEHEEDLTDDARVAEGRQERGPPPVVAVEDHVKLHGQVAHKDAHEGGEQHDELEERRSPHHGVVKPPES